MVGAALGRLAAFRLELLQQFALTLRQVLRRFHRDMDEHVTARRAAQNREAFAAKAELIAGLRARRYFHFGPRAVHHRNFDFGAQGRLGHAQRHPHQDVCLLTLEKFVWPYSDVDIQVAILCARPAGLALSGKPDACTIFDASWNRHLDLALALHRSGALAGPAGVADDPPLT